MLYRSKIVEISPRLLSVSANTATHIKITIILILEHRDIRGDKKANESAAYFLVLQAAIGV